MLQAMQRVCCMFEADVDKPWHGPTRKYQRGSITQHVRRSMQVVHQHCARYSHCDIVSVAKAHAKVPRPHMPSDADAKDCLNFLKTRCWLQKQPTSEARDSAENCGCWPLLRTLKRASTSARVVVSSKETVMWLSSSLRTFSSAWTAASTIPLASPTLMQTVSKKASEPTSNPSFLAPAHPFALQIPITWGWL